MVQGLGEWGQRWVRTDYGPDDLDPGLLLWDVRRNLAPGGMGTAPVTIQFVFPSRPARRRYYWLVDDTTEVDLCLADPGRDVDMTVEADLAALTRVWMGDARISDALADGRIILRGPSRLTRRFPGWFGQHPIFGPIPPGRPTPSLRSGRSTEGA